MKKLSRVYSPSFFSFIRNNIEMVVVEKNYYKLNTLKLISKEISRNEIPFFKGANQSVKFYCSKCENEIFITEFKDLVDHIHWYHKEVKIKN